MDRLLLRLREGPRADQGLPRGHRVPHHPADRRHRRPRPRRLGRHERASGRGPAGVLRPEDHRARLEPQDPALRDPGRRPAGRWGGQGQPRAGPRPRPGPRALGQRPEGDAAGPDPRLLLRRRRGAAQEVHLPGTRARGSEGRGAHREADRGPAQGRHRDPPLLLFRPAPSRRSRRPAGPPRAFLPRTRRRRDGGARPRRSRSPRRRPGAEGRRGGARHHRPFPGRRRPRGRGDPHLPDADPGSLRGRPRRQQSRRDHAIPPSPRDRRLEAHVRDLRRRRDEGREDLRAQSRLHGQEHGGLGGRANPDPGPRGSPAHPGRGLPEGQGPPPRQRRACAASSPIPGAGDRLRPRRGAQGARPRGHGEDRPLRLRGEGHLAGRPQGRAHHPLLRPRPLALWGSRPCCPMLSSGPSASAGAANGWSRRRAPSHASRPSA